MQYSGIANIVQRVAVTTVAVSTFYAFGDTLTLATGEQINGVYLGGDSRSIRFEAGDQVVTYGVNDVVNLEFGNMPAPADIPDAVTAPISPGRHVATTVPAGTQLRVKLIDPVDSKKDFVGKTYRASLDGALVDGPRIVLPNGCDVTLGLLESNSSGRITGKTSLTLAMKSITVNGKTYDVASTSVSKVSGSRATKSAEVIGGTAALGTLIGAIAGGGKGAAIGALSGGAVGTTAQVITSGEHIHVPSETDLTFILNNPLPISW